MSKIAINSVSNANVYLDGANLLGRALEVTLPSPKAKMVEHKGLGMVGEIEIPAGGFEKMEAKFKWASFYPEVIRKAGNPRKAVQVQVRSSIESYSGLGLESEVPLIVTLGGIFSEVPLGVFKQHEGVQPETNMTVYYLKVVAAGQDLLEVDVLNNIHKVAGSDVLSRYRSLIGG